MIEKIDKIKDLLIVPSVDEHPKLSINQMKILNILVELRAEAEKIVVPDVVGRREQLKSFGKSLQYKGVRILTDEGVERAVKDFESL